jgi:hypothetical protein
VAARAAVEELAAFMAEAVRAEADLTEAEEVAARVGVVDLTEVAEARVEAAALQAGAAAEAIARVKPRNGQQEQWVALAFETWVSRRKLFTWRDPDLAVQPQSLR